MDTPQQYQLKENPSVVYTAMKYTGDNYTEMHHWCPNIYRTNDGEVSLGRTIPLSPGDWVLHDEGKGYFWTYGKGAGGDGFLLDYEPYVARSAVEVKEGLDRERRRVDL